jgi:hypothetical protein
LQQTDCKQKQCRCASLLGRLRAACESNDSTRYGKADEQNYCQRDDSENDEGSCLHSAVKVCVHAANVGGSVAPMASEMRLGCPRVDSQYAVHAGRWSTSSTGASMKISLLLSIIPLLAACAQSPTAPSTQSSLSSNHQVLAPGTVLAARNPSGTGQPSASCGSDNAKTEPNGFSTGGFTNAEAKYAGSDGTPSLANGSSQAVSQYDVACYQLSNR